MASTPKPSDLQIRVLKWIHEGCPDDVAWRGYAHRTASRALAGRGLVTLTGSGPTWSVSLTDEGVRVLDAEVFAPERLLKQASNLLYEVSNAGGTLLIDKSVDPRNYRQLVDAANYHPDRRHGQRLAIHPVGSYRSPVIAVTAEVKWEEVAADMLRDAPLHTLPSAKGVAQDAGILAYINSKDWQYVSPALVNRAAGILQQIRLEAKRRGWPSQMGGDQDYEGWGFRRDGQLKLFPPNAEIQVKIFEVPVRGARKLSREEKTNSKFPQWMKDRQVHFQGSGALGLKWGHRTVQDEGSAMVEQQLPRLFATVEVDAFVRSHRESPRLSPVDLMEDNMPQLQLMVGAAQPTKTHWIEFEKRFRLWQDVSPMREFLQAMIQRSQSMEATERKAFDAWLASVSGQLDAIDPLTALDPAPPTGLASREEVLAYVRVV